MTSIDRSNSDFKPFPWTAVIDLSSGMSQLKIIALASFIAIGSFVFFPPNSEASEGSLIEGKPIESWLADLSGNQYVQRKRAFQTLWRVPKRELQDLFNREVPRGPAEAAMRNWLNLLQRMDASPESAAQMLDNLARIRSGDLETVVRLARNHQWNDLIALLAMLSSEDRDRLHSEPEDAAVIRVKLITMAWEDSRSDLIPALVDQLWDPTAASSARLQWKIHGFSDLANAPFYVTESDASELFTEKENLPAQQKKLLKGNSIPLRQFLKWELESRVEEAVLAAVQSQQFAIAEDMALRNSRWDLVPTFSSRLGFISLSRKNAIAEGKETESKETESSADDSLPFGAKPEDLVLKPRSITGGMQAIERVKEALLARWSGQPELAESLLDAIGNPGLEMTDVEGVLLALAAGDRFEQAMGIIEKRIPDEAFATYWVQEKVEDAFRVIGISELNKESIQAWLDNELKKEVRNSEEDTARTKRLAEVGALLARIGKSELANVIDLATIKWASDSSSHNSSSRQDEKFNRHDSSDDDKRERWKTVIGTWLLHHRRPRAIELLHTMFQEDYAEDLLQTVVDKLYPASSFPNVSPIAWPLLIAFSGEREGNRIQASKDLERFAWGHPPEDWNGRWEVNGIERIASKMLPTSTREILDSELPVQLARLAIENSRFDLARQWIAITIPKPIHDKIERALADLPSFQDLDLPLSSEEQRVSGVGDYLQILKEIYVAKQDVAREQTVLDWLHKIDPSLEYMIQRAELIRKLGDQQTSEDLQKLAMTIPLSPETMYGVHQSLDQAELLQDQAKFAKATTLSMSFSHPNFWYLSTQWFFAQQKLTDEDRDRPLLNDAERNRSIQDGLHAGRMHLWGLLNAYPARVRDFHNSLFAIERVHRFEARFAIEAGDWEAADQAVTRCWNANPDQIETLLELVPIARTKFGADKANKWIYLYVEPLEKHLAKFPDDTLVGNNLAWLYANLDFKLDRAKQLSKHVTEILVDDHMYLDTLGEVEFRLGNRQEAIAIANRCKQIAPREKHYQRQLVRYLRSKEDEN